MWLKVGKSPNPFFFPSILPKKEKNVPFSTLSSKEWYGLKIKAHYYMNSRLLNIMNFTFLI